MRITDPACSNCGSSCFYVRYVLTTLEMLFLFCAGYCLADAATYVPGGAIDIGPVSVLLFAVYGAPVAVFLAGIRLLTGMRTAGAFAELAVLSLVALALFQWWYIPPSAFIIDPAANGLR